MFDMTNREYVQKVIDSRLSSQIVIPLYVKVYNNTYSILEINDMKEFNPASFKVGFGTSVSLFDKNNFPTQYVLEFDSMDVFTCHNDDNGNNVRYIVFESNDVDMNVSVLHNQIHQYYVMLSQYINDIVSKYKSEYMKSLMNDDV